jgi:hypothetical protein
MKNRFVSYCVVAGLVLGGGLLWSCAGPQEGTPQGATPQEATPRTAWDTPDFSGFWYIRTGPGGAFYGAEGREFGDFGTLIELPDGSKFYNHVGAGEVRSEANDRQQDSPRREPTLDELLPPYKPEWRERVIASAARSMGNVHADDPSLRCVPDGLPRTPFGEGTQIVHGRDSIAVLFEEAQGPFWRIIYLDGRAHPENYDSSPYGHSVGRWEGDTLVIETVGLSDETWLEGVARGGPTEGMALFHSDQMRVVERWTRQGSELLWEATVHDPEALTKPWVMDPIRKPLGAKGDYIMPHGCDARDAQHVADMVEKANANKGASGSK